MAEQHGKTLVPQIRFAGFTDPWEQRKLGELADNIDTGRSVFCSESYGRYPVLGSTSVIGSDSSYDYEGAFLLTARVGANAGNLYRFAGKVKISDNTVFLQAPNSDFLFYLLSHFDLRKLSFGTGQPLVRASELRAVEIDVPKSENEQKSIAEFFDRLDSLITLHQRKYDKLCVLKKSMLDKMFPKGGSLYPEIRFAGFTDPWEQRKLGDVTNVCSGRDYKHLAEGPIPVYGTGGYMTSVSKALSYDEDAIGIGRKGTIDKPYRLQAPFWTVDTLFYAIPEASSDINFLLCSFLNVDWKSKDESTGLPSLSKRAINETEVLVPDNGEQRQIGAFFDRLDSLITLHQRKLELLRNIKKSMLDKMFV